MLRSTLVALAVLGVTCIAQAQSSTGGAEDAQQVCACGQIVGGGPVGFCFESAFCSDIVECTPAGDCPAGFTCVIGDCCGFPNGSCAPPCPGVPEACGNPEVCGQYTLICTPAGPGAPVPTVSEWGLIIMTGLLLAAGGFVIWRRRTVTA
jgi:hypothetical protein